MPSRKSSASKKNVKVGAQKKATKGRASKKSASKKSASATASKRSGATGSLGALAAWTGTPTTINRNENLQMSQTPNGMLIFSYFNQSKMANSGTLIVSSGGSVQPPLNVPGLANQPLMLINNWQGSNLSVSNTSVTTTPIWIVAAGPGMPGQPCKTLTSDGTSLTLGIYACGTANPPPSPAMLSLQANTSKLTIFAIQVQNTVWVVALNAAQEAGPNTQNPNTAPPAGYYATTTTNNYQSVWNWGGASVYIVNLSPGTSIPAQVSLLSQ
ncbi:MAG: hypothetical protein ACJ74T_19590 [Pyrinomonadaceae bacterium]